MAAHPIANNHWFQNKLIFLPDQGTFSQNIGNKGHRLDDGDTCLQLPDTVKAGRQ